MAKEKKEKKKKEKNVENGEKKNSNILKVILIVLLVFILVGGAAFAGYFVASKNTPKQIIEVEASGQLKTEAYYDLDEFLVNLSDEGKARYLKIKISLGYDEENEKLLPEIEKRKAAIRDSITNTLRTKKTTDLGTVDGETKLKEELIQRIDELLTQGQLHNIYFSEILIQ